VFYERNGSSRIPTDTILINNYISGFVISGIEISDDGGTFGILLIVPTQPNTGLEIMLH